MHLHKRFKNDAQETSQGLHPTEVFLGRLDDVLRTFLQNFKNKEQLTFTYFTQHMR